MKRPFDSQQSTYKKVLTNQFNADLFYKSPAVLNTKLRFFHLSFLEISLMNTVHEISLMNTVKSKTTSFFTMRFLQGSKRSISAYLVKHLILTMRQRNVYYLIDSVNTSKRSEAAKILFKQILVQN